jgi:hypothetical protein
MDHLNVLWWVTGKDLLKIPLHLYNFWTIKYVQAVNKQYSENRDAILLYVNVNSSFVMFVDKNGYLLIQLMVIKLALDLNK